MDAKQPYLSPFKLFLKSPVFIAMLIGILQGLAGLVSQPFHNHDSLWALPIFSFIFLGGLTAQLLLKNNTGRGEWLLAFGAGLLFALMTAWCFYQIRIPTDEYHYRNTSELRFSLTIFFGILAYVLIPYLQSWKKEPGIHISYNDLYRHSWDNFFIVSIGLLFTGILWLLLLLWMKLFKMIHIRFFEDFFTNEVFAWIISFAAGGIGITIGIRNEKIIDSLRNIALAICKFMMPLTSIITIIFTATLPFTGLQAIWDTKHSTPILLTLIAANIFFINGIFQNGSESNYPSLLKKFSNLSLLMLPILVAIAAYSTWLRIDQYGLTPDRIYSSLIILVGTCYSFSYAFNAIRRNTQWLINIRKPNIYIGILICTVIALTHSPILDPMTISAKNQYSRLINNKIAVEKFDFGALRYELGKPGLAYLQKIRDLQQHEHMAAIQEKLQKLDTMKNQYSWREYQRNEEHPKALALEILGGGVLPPDLATQITREEDPASGYYSITLYVLVKDINNDKQNEAIVWKKQNDYFVRDAAVWGLENGAWRSIGTYNTPFPDAIDLKQLFTEHNAELQNPTYQDLKMGNIQWQFSYN